MKINNFRKSFLTTVIFIPMVAASQPIACTKEELEGAYQSSIRIKNLDDVGKHYRKFGKCTDGYVAEAYCESISKILDQNWDEIVHSKEIRNADTMNALIRGISESWEYNISQRILNKAKTRCSKEAQKLCDAILSEK